MIVLAYHAVEDGPPPLCVPPALFEQHADVIAESGADVELTFDDGAASAFRVAEPILLARGLTATVFCVAGHLGGRNDWPSQRPDAYRFELARADELAASALRIASHSLTHPAGLTEHEVVESKRVLEQATGRPVTAFAYPYGRVSAYGAVRSTYDAAYALGNRTGPGGDPWAIPRVDVHYLRHPKLLRRALAGKAGGYLALRRTAARARRLVTSDYAR